MAVVDELVLSVSGMTCEHCVAAVTSAAGDVEGVREVAVDLVPSGTSRVRVAVAPGARRPVVTAHLAAAIAEEGYAVEDVTD